jgi:hypothetical protein
MLLSVVIVVMAFALTEAIEKMSFGGNFDSNDQCFNDLPEDFSLGVGSTCQSVKTR